MGVVTNISERAMQKAKTPSTTHRIIPKKWRTSKSNKMPNGPNKNLWTPEGSCTWSQMGGRKIVLGNTTLLNLSEVERLALQKIAVAKLQALNLGCAITIPKEGATPKRNKRSAFSLKRYRSNSNNNSSNIGNFILDFRDKRVKDKDAEGKVFGIPLAKCICNDQETRRRRSGLIERRGSLDFPPRRTRKSSCSSTSSIENIRAPLDGDTEKEQKQAVTSSESLSGSDHSGSSPHLEVPPLVRSVSSPTNNRPPAETHILDYRPSLTPSCPQVPNVVNTCLKHLETYGLRTLGIFRVGSSKKRTKQLREEFDSCQDVKLNEEHNPHDVAALLKEFFRDLPEPIMSRELYNAFVATRKLKTSESQLSALRLLVSLLPVPNRDTLWALVKFLLKVSEHSSPTFDETGQELPGNKMDTHNLATLFGPNILHKIKGGASQEFQVESMDRAEERREIITCIQDLIEHHTKIFQVPAELHDDILRHLLDTKPDAIDYLLNQMTHNHQISIEIDPDTSVTFEEIVYPENQTGSRCLRRTETFNGQQRDSPHRSLRQTLSSDGTAATAAAKDYLRVPVRRATRCRISDNLKNIYRRSAPEGSLVTEDECASSGKNKEPVLEPAGSASSSIQSLEVPNVISPRRRRHFREKRTPNLTINIAEELSGSTSSGYSSQRSPSCSKDFNSSTSSLSSYNPSSSRCSLSPARHPPVEIHRWSLSPPANSSSAKSNPNSPRIHSRDYKYATSSLTRPLGVHAVETRGDEDPPVGSVEWQRERWRHWQTLARRVDDSDEQETLV
ncbi:rho GTPase-activating protein 6-like isoform X2 [Tubulanus polymorphus]|uniref:rho GTPase-activating protein 6-like isoform X2 n=1 Tax=Tubulanus polymorphus TaxID=672921 RepID=UPI003DA4671D